MLLKSSPKAVRATLRCHAARDSRRVMLGLSGLTIIALPLSSANALILDEDDEDLIEKAKANRKTRLAEQKATTRSFLTSEGLKDVAGDKDLIPVQKGVLRLSQIGVQIEGGDINAASLTLTDGWAKEFDTAAGKLGGSAGVITKLSALQSAAGKNDPGGSRKAYAELIAELRSWTQSAGIADRIRGIN